MANWCLVLKGIELSDEGVDAPDDCMVEEGIIVAALSWVVFAGPVQSGFLPPKQATVDRNRSRTNPDIEGTKPNHLGPVFCGPWCRFRLI